MAHQPVGIWRPTSHVSSSRLSDQLLDTGGGIWPTTAQRRLCRPCGCRGGRAGGRDEQHGEHRDHNNSSHGSQILYGGMMNAAGFCKRRITQF